MAKKRVKTSGKSSKRMRSGGRKKAVKKSTVRQKRQANIGRGFPKRMVMTHKYTDAFITMTSAGPMSTYIIGCNGMYDPNISAGGHQPLYFDQMTALYNHYTVIGSKIKATFIPAAANSAPFAFGINVNDDTVITPGNYNEMDEQAQSATRYTTAVQTRNPVIVKKWSAKKIFGGSILANTDLQGTVTANPTEKSNFVCYMQTLDGTTSVTCNLVVEVTYIAVWSEVKDVGNS